MKYKIDVRALPDGGSSVGVGKYVRFKVAQSPDKLKKIPKGLEDLCEKAIADVMGLADDRKFGIRPSGADQYILPVKEVKEDLKKYEISE
jgi:hypothetical protein